MAKQKVITEGAVGDEATASLNGDNINAGDLEAADAAERLAEIAVDPSTIKRPYTVRRPLDHQHAIYPEGSTVYLTDAEAVEHLAHQVIKPAVVEVPLEEVV